MEWIGVPVSRNMKFYTVITSKETVVMTMVTWHASSDVSKKTMAERVGRNIRKEYLRFLDR